MAASLLLSDPLTGLNGFVPFSLAAFSLLALGYMWPLYLAIRSAQRGGSLGALCLLLRVYEWTAAVY